MLAGQFQRGKIDHYLDEVFGLEFSQYIWAESQTKLKLFNVILKY